MSQNNYDVLLMQALLKSPNHIRGLAKTLGTNQTTIARKANNLYKKNVIDFRQEGKNKVFFLKKSLEAKEHIHITEIHKLLKIIEKNPTLRRITEQIQNNKKISLAILFGSYAKSIAKTESDIDIYIETSDNSLKEEVERIDTKISVKIGQYDKENLLIKEIEKNHVILKGIERYYEKNNIFI